jgi:SAM-dependent methyltransferase
LEHLASLGLDLEGKSVLEVGAGIGLHTEFFEARGCRVLSTDGNPDNVAEIRRRYPHRQARLLDLDAPVGLGEPGEFDVVYCYGTLYHLARPDEALQALAEVCGQVILLETCVSLGRHAELHLVRDSASNNQAIHRVGCRPTRLWVIEALRAHFGYAYITATQPDHPDFETDWNLVGSPKLYRAVFVGSKQPHANDLLQETVPDAQARFVLPVPHRE